ncbi:MAG: hypothetical protein ACE5FD_04890 [Anaerolineae bacterium]
MLISKETTKKITVTLPEKLIDRLDKYIPPRQRSSFIAEAISTHLAIAEQVEALEESAGVWEDARYPELATENDIDQWLLEFRQGWHSHE